MRERHLAYCKHVDQLTIQTGSEFDDLHAAGTRAPLSGIYGCEDCGISVVSHNGHDLPGRDHHRHADDTPILWRLIVRSHLA